MGVRKLYSFNWDCGRMGDLDGLFVADSDEIEKIIGKEIYFGEVLGKHSEIFGELEADDLKVITDDPTVIKIFDDHKISSGFNPLDYYEETGNEEDEN